jgi:hypothetical protein
VGQVLVKTGIVVGFNFQVLVKYDCLRLTSFQHMGEALVDLIKAAWEFSA